MSDISERAQRLTSAIEGDFPDSWKPREEGDHPRMLIGTFERLETGHTRAYGEKPIVVLRDLDGKDWSVWLLHSVLRNEFERLRPRRGELVAIRYEGHVAADGDRPGYEKYRVAVDRAGESGDWDALARPEAASQFAGIEQPDRVGPGERAPVEERRDREPVANATDVRCEACGFLNGHHADGCPNDIPF